MPKGIRLYISHACPFAHRVLVALALKDPTGLLPVTAVDHVMPTGGWRFASGDPATGAGTLMDVYRLADRYFAGRATVPLLFDIDARRVVASESTEILRWIDRRFEGSGPELFPSWCEREQTSSAG